MCSHSLFSPVIWCQIIFICCCSSLLVACSGSFSCGTDTQVSWQAASILAWARSLAQHQKHVLCSVRLLLLWRQAVFTERSSILLQANTQLQQLATQHPHNAQATHMMSMRRLFQQHLRRLGTPTRRRSAMAAAIRCCRAEAANSRSFRASPTWTMPQPPCAASSSCRRPRQSSCSTCWPTHTASCLRGWTTLRLPLSSCDCSPCRC